jgi:ABC-type uncharacterized transport system permease subunit
VSTAGIVTWLGHYKPPMILGAAIYCVASGLITTFSSDQPVWRAYGLQILAGFGLGMCLEQGYLAVQAQLSRDDTPIGIALLLFAQTLAGYVSSSIVLIKGLFLRLSPKPFSLTRSSMNCCTKFRVSILKQSLMLDPSELNHLYLLPTLMR